MTRSDARDLLPVGSWVAGDGWRQVDLARLQADRPDPGFSQVQLGPGGADFDCDG